MVKFVSFPDDKIKNRLDEEEGNSEESFVLDIMLNRHRIMIIQKLVSSWMAPTTE